ncbi:MAG: polyphosphate polymerase domain-containing protein [Ruminococcus sp.]|jgi:hypothetical protein
MQVYRNEWKYYISLWEGELLKQRLLPFMEMDPHAENGRYTIRSLYFDDYWNSAYEEKIMGVEGREKWRIRIYNFSDSGIKLERKKKTGNYIHKDSASLTREEYDQIMAGAYTFLLQREDPLCREFYYECVVKLQRPKVVVDYERTPLIRREGDVRITFDQDVRGGAFNYDIFDEGLPVHSVLEANTMVLEVKFTEMIPAVIKELLPLHGQQFSAISKYTLCCEQMFYRTDPMAGISKTNRRRKR